MKALPCRMASLIANEVLPPKWEVRISRVGFARASGERKMVFTRGVNDAPKEMDMLQDIAITLGSLVVVTVSALFAVHHMR